MSNASEFYEHLRGMDGDKKVDTIDFYIYSRGGTGDAVADHRHAEGIL